MAKVNSEFRKLKAGYLFPEIARRTREYLAAHPGTQLIRLGIGDTTRPIAPSVIAAMHQAVDRLADVKTYSGYGNEQGEAPLRDGLVKFYKDKYGVELKSDEFFVSDGAKPDSANLQTIFAADSVVAVQDPVYPVYVDAAVMEGKSSGFDDGRYQGLFYMECNEANGFFPSLPESKVDLINLCSPNNPTGTVATHEQLRSFVDYARANKAVIIYDAAYANYISDPSLPRTIYEIPGAKTCAIEINSFSKWAGFTGLRLGWSIVPAELQIENSQPDEVRKLWHRRQTTRFNGASNVVQAGGVAALSEAGQAENDQLIAYYMENARLICEGLESVGIRYFGGKHSPFIWLKVPGEMTSWDFFDLLIREANVVGTPGAGFGKCGEGYFRLSAFGHRDQTIQAIKNIQKIQEQISC